MVNKNKSNKKAKNKLKNEKNFLKKGIIFCILIFLVLFLIISFVFKLIKNEEFYNVVDRTSDIKKYNEQNNDYKAIGWIKVQGTNIDYPVLFYDDAPISDVTQNIGWTYRNVKKLDDRTVIEGHNILNLSSNPLIADKNSRRFEQLLSFYDPMFVKNNKYIEYSLNNENYVFKIFAVGFPKTEIFYTQYDYEKKELKEYINDAIDNSLYKFDVDVNEKDKIISLYTCTRFYGYTTSVSFRVDARLVRENEQIKNYETSTTSNYKKAKNYSDRIKNKQEVKS